MTSQPAAFVQSTFLPPLAQQPILNSQTPLTEFNPQGSILQQQQQPNPQASILQTTAKPPKEFADESATSSSEDLANDLAGSNVSQHWH